jgi:hypothetical protein
MTSFHVASVKYSLPIAYVHVRIQQISYDKLFVF